MQTTAAAPTKRSSAFTLLVDNRRSLQFVNFYRWFVGLLFSLLQISGYAANVLPIRSPGIFLSTSLAYLAVAVVAWALLRLEWPPVRWHIYSLAGADIAVVTLLVYACGGVSSGLGMLLIPPLSAASMRLPQRMAGFLAAVATLAILGQETWHAFSINGLPLSFTQAGILGVVFFVTALASSAITQRARESEALAVQRSEDLASLAELNERIIQYMQTGVVVIDPQGTLRMVNDAARHLLDIQHGLHHNTLDELSPALAEALTHWREAPDQPPEPFTPEQGDGRLLPNFIPLAGGEGAPLLILLEDERRVGERAQQMKLAALGQLTASIAHEVRNPLGAISHAAQLLGESASLGQDDEHLVSIVNRHAARINHIIEDILRLSRRDSAEFQRLKLRPLLERFAQDFTESHPDRDVTFDLDGLDPAIELRVDASQIQQVMNNLWENSVVHAGGKDGPTRIRLASGYMGIGRRAYLDVSDNGPGISPEVAEHMFDPFFTTARAGTGLGLYIVRELCECNHAAIHYVAQRGNGGCFRIIFATAGRRVMG